MSIRVSTESLARASGRHPWLTVGLWALAFVLSIAFIATLLGSAVTTDDYFTNDPESDRADELLSKGNFDSGPQASEIVIVRSPTLTVDDPQYRDFVETLFNDLKGLGENVTLGGTHYFQSDDESLVSENRRATLLPFGGVRDIDRVHEVVLGASNKAGGFEVFITGRETLDKDFEEISQEDLGVEFIIGIPAAIVIMVVVFGALLVTAVPVLLALLAIVMAVGITALVGQIFEFSFFVTNVIAMIGLAVGVDYSLFIVSRYRDERARGLDKLDAIGVAGATSGRAVFFSGMTVVVALLGMLIIPFSIFRSVAAGAIFVTVAAILASMTLLPAVLFIMGDKVNSLRIPFIGVKAGTKQPDDGGFWTVVARFVMGHPIPSLLVAGAIMIAAASPYLDINMGFQWIDTFPDDAVSKQGYLALEKDFSFGLVEPTRIVVSGNLESESVQGAIEKLRQTIEADKDFNESKIKLDPRSNLAVITTFIDGDSAEAKAVGAMRRLRNDYIPDTFDGVPAEALTGGETATNIDFFDLSERYLPIVVGIVMALSFLLLMVVFRSIVVPIKAIIMNLLSVGAAYGLMVLVFQHGVGADLLGLTQVDSIAAWVPLFLFSVLFGISMDYHVFLLSRIRERYGQTHDNAESVAYGLRSTGGLITGAALIMIAVFGGFAMGQLVMFQQMGFGLAVAVFLDATVVRSVLVPASMRLLGDYNWYLPSMLSWLPEVRFEGEEVATPSPVRTV